ncbi:dCTP deaminase [Acinetobacter sp. ACIN00229]|uniref:dCTP deaminase n=1 Tax=Acinetobacter sp. ACIN00229 TaxID=2792607 RepID=UPI0018DF3B06|nr:dCTP deaminase [Acinetobacter sp. ACIN00229]MBI0421283.1 dCTP deaminase [Acinetobacter sp. ACIN00229]
MILTGQQIILERSLQRITIEPFDVEKITTNSFDLLLGDELIEYIDEILDPKKKNEVRRVQFDENGEYFLKKGSFVLGHSNEIVGSNHYVPIIHARSSVARLGLFVHVTADLIDIGSIGQVTFQLFATQSVVLKRGMKIGQVSFWVPHGEISLYRGKYHNSIGPQASLSHLDKS